ncbi:MAG: hypothetical protein E6Q88_11680 [Lysobacteraceae bacterium]|nr:MAG: hypothetical protein E6Q88_11680 [Xanthomonadaceae bacterium]
MSESTLRIRLPRLPHPDIFSNPELTIMVDDRSALLSYDPITKTGIIYNLAHHRWTITTPVDFQEFAATCALAGYAVRESKDSSRWLRACGATGIHEAPIGVRH